MRAQMPLANQRVCVPSAAVEHLQIAAGTVPAAAHRIGKLYWKGAALLEPERDAPEGGYRVLNAETGASEPATPGYMPERAIAVRRDGDGPG